LTFGQFTLPPHFASGNTLFCILTLYGGLFKKRNSQAWKPSLKSGVLQPAVQPLKSAADSGDAGRLTLLAVPASPLYFFF
jgi:hypothetical protein